MAIEYLRQGDVAIVRLSRPDRFNAVEASMSSGRGGAWPGRVRPLRSFRAPARRCRPRHWNPRRWQGVWKALRISRDHWMP